MKYMRSIGAGIAGALAMSLAMFVMRRLGIDVSLERLLGSMLPSNDLISPWVGGFILHLMVGAVAGLVYAFVFEVAVQRSGPVIGAGMGLAHGMLAGLFMSAIPAMNPLDPTATSAPGPFLSHMTLGPLVFLLLHCLFGAVVGTVYGPPLQKPQVYSGRPV
jgi:hypothetical protein